MITLGTNCHPLWGPELDATMRGRVADTWADTGAEWVRVDVGWKDFQSAAGVWREDFLKRFDAIVDDYASRGLKVLVMTYWPPADASSTGKADKNGDITKPDAWGRMAGQLARRWHGRVHAFEFGNEFNISTFSRSKDPVLFGRNIKAAYATYKREAPTDVPFVMGAPTYLGLAGDWLRKALDAGARANFDIAAIHPYMSPGDNPPDVVTDHRNGRYTWEWSILGIEEVRDLLGPGVPLWATEFGWSVHPNKASDEPWLRGIDSEQLRAQYVVRALELMADLGVSVAFYYCAIDTPGNLHESNFGGLEEDGTPKPLIAALRDYVNPGIDPAKLIAAADSLTAVANRLESLAAGTLDMANRARVVADDLVKLAQ